MTWHWKRSCWRSRMENSSKATPRQIRSRSCVPATMIFVSAAALGIADRSADWGFDRLFATLEVARERAALTLLRLSLREPFDAGRFADLALWSVASAYSPREGGTTLDRNPLHLFGGAFAATARAVPRHRLRRRPAVSASDAGAPGAEAAPPQDAATQGAASKRPELLKVTPSR